MTLKALSCMTAYRSQPKSTSNPAITAAISTALSHVTILSAVVGERQWRTINHKNFTVKVRLDFLMASSLRIGHPVSTLSINGQVQGHPPLGGLSQKLAIFNNLPSVVKLGTQRGPISINILAI